MIAARQKFPPQKTASSHPRPAGHRTPDSITVTTCGRGPFSVGGGVGEPIRRTAPRRLGPRRTSRGQCASLPLGRSWHRAQITPDGRGYTPTGPLSTASIALFRRFFRALWPLPCGDSVRAPVPGSHEMFVVSAPDARRQASWRRSFEADRSGRSYDWSETTGWPQVAVDVASATPCEPGHGAGRDLGSPGP
jgi:hypothetical protein